MHGNQTEDKDLEIYDFPYITKYMKRVKCFSYIPMLPTFNKELLKCSCCKRDADNTKKPKLEFVYENNMAYSEETNGSTAAFGQSEVLSGKDNKSISSTHI